MTDSPLDLDAIEKALEVDEKWPHGSMPKCALDPLWYRTALACTTAEIRRLRALCDEKDAEIERLRGALHRAARRLGVCSFQMTNEIGQKQGKAVAQWEKEAVDALNKASKGDAG